MRKLVLGAALAGFAASAAAGEIDRADARYYDGNDYSAKVYYRLDFGGTSANAQSMGLRLDNQLAESHGAPAAMQVGFDKLGTSVKLHGMDLTSLNMAAGQTSGGLFASLSTAQWVAIGFTAVVFGTVVSEAASSNDTGSGAQ